MHPGTCNERNSTWYVRNMSPVTGAWLLLIVTSGKEASLRVFVWRELRKMGALYLHKSVCLLPDRPEVRTRLQPVLGRIRGQGGSGRLITVAISGDEHQALVDEQRRDRDTEYVEVVERVPQLLAEIEMETARGRATYAEVEESEADLERFEKWLTAIANRDYFDAPRGDDARAAVQRCREALAVFEIAALAADNDEERLAESGTQLTVVKDQP
jgi:Protein ChrB, N-terminal